MPIPEISEMPKLEESDLNRFWTKVAITANPKTCWEWNGVLNNRGYGSLMVKDKRYLAHRLSYFINKKTDPQSLLVLHSCDNRKCLNPNHLFLGTAKDNTQDMIKKGRKGVYDHSLRDNTNIARGEKSGRSVLTKQKVLNIRESYQKDNVSQRSLAKKYKVHPATIQFIIERRNWKHI